LSYVLDTSVFILTPYVGHLAKAGQVLSFTLFLHLTDTGVILCIGHISLLCLSIQVCSDTLIHGLGLALDLSNTGKASDSCRAECVYAGTSDTCVLLTLKIGPHGGDAYVGEGVLEILTTI
jgi:hypothetical protein